MENNTAQQAKDRFVSVRFDEATFSRLEEVAANDERSLSYICRIAVEQYLNRRKM